jgi:enoyl-CoA hydratase/carnithine racemase
MTHETLRLEIAGGVAAVTLDRPPVNAINSRMLDEIADVFGGFATDPSVKVVVVSGAGKNFAAGADIKEIAALEPGAAVEAFSRRGIAAFDAIASLPKPVIAAVRGFCLGGGNELAMACHMRYCDPSAKFGQPEIKLGICPGFAGSQRLPRLVGMPAAIEMLATGEPIGAEDAFRLGLAQRVVAPGEDVVAVARATAALIAQYSLVAITGTMEAAVTSRDTWMKDGARHEAKLFGRLSTTHDMREGFAAFIEKRKPRFSDQ